MPPPQRAASRWPLTLVPSAFAAIELLRLALLARRSDTDLARFLPDDSFYYLILGRNFARLGRWTFDGVEPATGFHLLWGYLIAALYRIAPGMSLHAILLVLGAISLLAATLAAWLTARLAHRLFSSRSLPGVLVVFLSSIALLTLAYPMETALACLFSAMLLTLLFSAEANTTSSLAAALALGFAGTLARGDFAVLPASFALVYGIAVVGRSNARSSPTQAILTRSIAATAGALAGIALIALHTHAVSGAWVQSSVFAKRFWSEKLGPSLQLPAALLTNFLDPSYNLPVEGRRLLLLSALKWILWAAIATGIAATLRRSAQQRASIPAENSNSSQRLFVLALLFFTFAYAALLTLDSAGVQPWYSALLLTPVALLVAAAFSAAPRAAQPALLAATLLFCGWSVRQSLRPQFPWQGKLALSGLYLRAHPELLPAGAWNAGIQSYFAGGGVVNLDGLVNDRVVPHLRAGTLAAYIRERNLRSITDYQVMWTPYSEQRGGYADGTLERCVTADDFLRGQPGADDWMALRLYRVDAACLSSSAPAPSPAP